MSDCCDHCEHEHPFDKDTDRVFLFLRQPEMDHIITVCPNCNFATRIFASAENIMALLQMGFALTISADAPDEIRHGYERTAAREVVSEAVREELERWWGDDLPDVPPTV